MEYYYRIDKGTETFKKCKEIRERIKDFYAEYKKFQVKYNIARVTYPAWYFCGITDVIFKKTPSDVSENWKKGNTYGFFTLRKKVKDNELKDEWETLKKLAVDRKEIETILNNTQYPFTLSGFEEISDDCYVISIEHKEYYTLPQDCVEITNVEYEILKNNANRKEKAA